MTLKEKYLEERNKLLKDAKACLTKGKSSNYKRKNKKKKKWRGRTTKTIRKQKLRWS